MGQCRDQVRGLPPVASQSELNTLTSKAGALRNWTPITGNGPLAVRTIAVACVCVRPKWAIQSPAPELIPPLQADLPARLNAALDAVLQPNQTDAAGQCQVLAAAAARYPPGRRHEPPAGSRSGSPNLPRH